VLEPGEISLHHVRVIHGSPANLSPTAASVRVRYIRPAWHRLRRDDSASLVRAKTGSIISNSSAPDARHGPRAFVALHRAIAERNARILYRGTQVKSFNDAQALPRAAG